MTAFRGLTGRHFGLEAVVNYIYAACVHTKTHTHAHRRRRRISRTASFVYAMRTRYDVFFTASSSATASIKNYIFHAMRAAHTMESGMECRHVCVWCDCISISGAPTHTHLKLITVTTSRAWNPHIIHITYRIYDRLTPQSIDCERTIIIKSRPRCAVRLEIMFCETVWC